LTILKYESTMIPTSNRCLHKRKCAYMKNFTYVVGTIPELRDYLNTGDIQLSVTKSKSVLIQVFSSLTEIKILEGIINEIFVAMPDAVIVGSTSVGEIVHGLLHVGSTVLSISFFDDTAIGTSIVDDLESGETLAGKELMKNISGMGTHIAGVLMLATPLSMEMSKLFDGMEEEPFDFPIFGGGAGAYDPNLTTTVFSGTAFYACGAIAVVFLSETLKIHTRTFLGWKPLSKEFTMTESDGMLLKKIDGERAFDVYNRYLNIPNDRNFFDNALEFPLLVRRNGKLVARTPFFADRDGCIGFLADIKQGEKFQIGYGDPDLILNNTTVIQNEISDFQPDSIFLYACICRRFLLQNDVNLETKWFESIAPTVGFYTYGEFYSYNSRIYLLNSTIVVAAFREGEGKSHTQKVDGVEKPDGAVSSGEDPFSNKHSRIISRLLYFIRATTAELEEANKELKRIAGIDKLTQINNRRKLDEILQEELYRSTRYKTGFSVLLLDLDHFKKVNDKFGHLIGDMVLLEIGKILKENVRVSDTVGRWGGEEFLIILPQTSQGSALIVAEKIRQEVERAQFQGVGHITCSLGAATFRIGDNQDKILLRADRAMYAAKNSGRNQVKGENHVF